MTSTDSLRCAFVTVWLGPFPIWMDFFLESCRRNARTFDWHIFTDQSELSSAPSNVFFHPMDLAMFNKRLHDRLPYDVTIKTPYKLCDVKPLYGLLFSDDLESYAYWGHCDIDMVWGDLETLLRPELEKGYDIITVDAIRTSGFCTIYKNKRRINRLCTKIPHLEAALQRPEYVLVDEWRLPQLLAVRPDISVSYALRHVEQPDMHTIIWKNGRLFASGEEHVLFHMHKWFDIKKHMIVDAVEATDERWLITREGFFSAEDLSIASSDIPRLSEGFLIRANEEEGDDLLSLIESIHAHDDRPILVIDCGLPEHHTLALSTYVNVMRIPLHAYGPDASTPSLIERTPFDRTLWLSPHCIVLQPLDEAFVMMREHIVIGMHHDALVRGLVPSAMFHLSTDVIGYRADADWAMLDEWKKSLAQDLGEAGHGASDIQAQDALLRTITTVCPHLTWSIAPCQVWNAAPLPGNDPADPFAANKRRGDRIVNRAWAGKSSVRNPTFRIFRSLYRRYVGKNQRMQMNQRKYASSSASSESSASSDSYSQDPWNL